MAFQSFKSKPFGDKMEDRKQGLAKNLWMESICEDCIGQM
jgi:hypothetical protein